MAIPLSADAFSSIYRQYKEDTAYIAGWLVEKSKECGYQADTQKLPVPARLKGRARKIAKAAIDTGGVIATAKHGLKVSEFVPMAEAIARYIPKVRIPAGVGRLFTRAITQRKKVSDWFNSPHSSKADDEINQSHLHFIEVLQRAHKVLQPLISTSAPSTNESPKRQKPHSQSVPLRNAFANLTVEETVDIQDNEESHRVDIDISNLPAVNPVSIQQDEEDIETDFFFAIECFLLEILNIRNMLKGLWKRYEATNYDLVIASLSTNTAIELVRQAEFELDHNIKRPRKYPADEFPAWTLPGLVFCRFHPYLEKMHGLKDILVNKSEKVMINPEHVCVHAEFTLWSTFQLLKYYQYEVEQVLGRHHNTAMPPVGMPQMLPIAEDIQLRTCKWVQIFRYYGLVEHHSQYADDTYACDEITRGVRHLFENWDEVPIWVSFGMQVFFDIQDTLGHKLETPFIELQHHVRQVVEDFEKYDFDTPFPLDDSGQATRDMMKVIVNRARKHALEDEFDRISRLPDGPTDEYEYKFTGPWHPIMGEIFKEKDYILKRHPLRCGLMKYDTFMWAQYTGVKLAGDSHTLDRVWLLAHLYVAGQLLHPDSPAWPDMEYVLWRQDPVYLFFGQRPQSLGESHRKYNLGLGHSATSYAKNRRKTQVRDLDPRRLGRFFRCPGLLTDTLREDEHGHHATPGSSNVLIVRLMQKLCSPKGRETLAQQEGLDHRTDVPTAREKRFNQWQPLDLLHEHEKFLVADAVDLYFDWYRLCEVCSEIWGKMMARLNEIYEETPNTRRHPVYITQQILEYAAADEDEMGGLKKATAETAPELRKVWQMMQDTIQTVKQTRPSGYKIWKADTAVNRLLDLHPEVARVFFPASYKRLYRNWDSKELEKSETHLHFSGVALVLCAVSTRDTNGTHYKEIRDLLLVQPISKPVRMVWKWIFMFRQGHLKRKLIDDITSNPEEAEAIEAYSRNLSVLLEILDNDSDVDEAPEQPAEPWDPHQLRGPADTEETVWVQTAVTVTGAKEGDEFGGTGKELPYMIGMPRAIRDAVEAGHMSRDELGSWVAREMRNGMLKTAPIC
ncbi:hypothetical protein BDV96DRAFT_262247 [Lophiotrema nucula]|uniref:DUF6604 domain-containing protein n=1 Tax=Lophiotrema nucula TaxID=690887 RepID=A0A6A5YN81_9PLEO|nr:hypothetical protein BDV96DRAFT_262247 [Lophiotrema nucula]